MGKVAGRAPLLRTHVYPISRFVKSTRRLAASRRQSNDEASDAEFMKSLALRGFLSGSGSASESDAEASETFDHSAGAQQLPVDTHAAE